MKVVWRLKSVREGGQRLVVMHKYSSPALESWCAGEPIDAKGQCGKNWPGSCRHSMCLMCSDIVLVEINYLSWSEEVTREIPWLDMNCHPTFQVPFVFVWSLFLFLFCFSCENATRLQHSAAPGSGWQMTNLHKGRELLILPLQWFFHF